MPTANGKLSITPGKKTNETEQKETIKNICTHMELDEVILTYFEKLYI